MKKALLILILALAFILLTIYTNWFLNLFLGGLSLLFFFAFVQKLLTDY